MLLTASACRYMYVHGPGSELEGEGVQTPRPGAFGAEHRHGAGEVTCTYLHCECLGDET